MQINLLAPSTTLEIQKKLNYERRNPLKPLIGLSLAVIVLGYGTLSFLEGRMERELLSTKTKITALNQVAQKRQQELNLVKQLKAKQQKLKAINQHKIAWQSYVDPIQASMPTSLKLTQLKLEAGGETVEIEGESPNASAVAQFAAKLQASKPFNSNLLLVKTEKDEDAGKYSFAIKATTRKISLQEVESNE